MWGKSVVTGLVLALSGCYLIINIPPMIQFGSVIQRDTRTNKGAEWSVCGGRVIVVNGSSARIEVLRDDRSPNADRVREGIPYEHIVVKGYDQYGELVGWTEETFLCTGKGPPERWIITDPKLWWHQ